MDDADNYTRLFFCNVSIGKIWNHTMDVVWTEPSWPSNPNYSVYTLPCRPQCYLTFPQFLYCWSKHLPTSWDHRIGISLLIPPKRSGPENTFALPSKIWARATRPCRKHQLHRHSKEKWTASHSLLTDSLHVWLQISACPHETIKVYYHT